MPKVDKKSLSTANGKVVHKIDESLAALAVPVASLTPDPRNAKRHPERNMQAIMDSLSEFGQTKPLVVRREGMVVMAGNGTLEAAKRLGWTHVAANVKDMTEVKAIKYGMADNRSADLGEYDMQVLDQLHQILQDAGEGQIGWTQDELEILRMNDWTEPEQPETPPEDPGAQIDRAEELRKKWGTELGQLWVIGRHRLLCGDSKSIKLVRMALGNNAPTLVFTDPPYGVGIGGKNRLLNSVQKAGRCLSDIEDDTITPADLHAQLLPAFKNIKQVMADDCTVMLTSPQGGELGMMMMMMMKDAGLPIRHVLIWVKNAPTFSLGRLDYDYQHEPILFTWGKRHKKRDAGEFKTSTWHVNKPQRSPEHATTKPVELYTNALLRHTDAGDVLLDIYCGSGTALVAAEQTGRVGCGIELEPKYIAVTLERLSQMGLEPKLEQ